ncbi:MAG: saccharopine dehydrogenase NADP-binding domain-containing protein, partial [Deltaproteobacteria bacterium]|nr:saccharopine dehydrogenase NADP-binding domain-containing protein [Deltaproteobacteria bacterium]
RLLSEADVVVNTVGPYFRFGVPVLRAAIEAGCHYLDICDDWEPTLEMLELDATAREAGVTAVIGLGASPGISNILAVKAIAELDRATEIYTAWDLEGAVPERVGREPSAAMVHGFHQLSGTIQVYDEGRYTEIRPLEPRTLDYPGLGPGHLWTIGHPEAVTLPHTYPDLRRSMNLMFASRFTLFGTRVLSWLVTHGWFSEQRAAWWAERLENAPVDPDHTAQLHALAKGGLPPLFALAMGEKDGRPASAAVMITSAPRGGMGGVTGVPLAVGLDLLGRGKLENRGVFAPEAIVDPDAFFEGLAPHCVPMVPVEQLTVTTRSWEDTTLAEKLSAIL